MRDHIIKIRMTAEEVAQLERLREAWQQAATAIDGGRL